MAYADMPSCNSEKDGDPYDDDQGCNGSDDSGCNSDSDGGCEGDGCGSGSSRAASIGSSLGLMAAVAYGIGRRRTK